MQYLDGGKNGSLMQLRFSTRHNPNATIALTFCSFPAYLRLPLVTCSSRQESKSTVKWVLIG